MYILLIGVHVLFMFIAHLLGYYVIEGVFLVLMLFFLLYFSPIFFFKNQKENIVSLFSLDFSPQKSLLIPLVLTYLGIYILAFTFSGGFSQAIHAHLLIFLAIFGFFLGYIFSFSWNHRIFFDILGFHLIASYVTLFFVGIYYFFFRDNISWVDGVFALVVIGFSFFFFFYSSIQKKELFYVFLCALFFAFGVLIIFFFSSTSSVLFFGLMGILSILLFEGSNKILVFRDNLLISRSVFLGVNMLMVVILTFLLIYNFDAVYFLGIFVFFLFFVHTRFSNIIVYVLGIFEIFLLYVFLFFSLVSVNSVFSTLIFLFFLSLVIISGTYFWQQKYEYDFLIMHYFSIGFSIIFFLYCLVFLNWGDSLVVFSSFGFLFLALLLFLSYFRFYK